MIDKEFIAVFHYDDGGSNRCGTEPYRYAEEIVRCGECKWFDSKGHCMRLTAEYGTYEDVRTDDFCSYGERKDDE